MLVRTLSTVLLQTAVLSTAHSCCRPRPRERPGTICELAGVDPAAGEPRAPAPLDGVNAWGWLSGRTTKGSRDMIVYEHNMYGDNSKVSNGMAQVCTAGYF